jgi:hypothetical protein
VGSEGISLSGWGNTHLRMRNGVRIAGNAQTMMRLSIVKMPLLPLSNKKGEK